MIKQLMAAKISRNDAVAFVKGYRAVKAAGMEHLFKELILPPAPPMQGHTVSPMRFCVKRAASRNEMEGAGSVNVERYIKDSLARELASNLVENGAIRVSRKDVPDVAIFCAEVWIVPSVRKEDDYERI